MDDSGAMTDPRIGELVDDRYRVLEAMAAGSMGVVYKAERVPVGKLVAIKFLHAPFANDAEFLARFERETRVMSKLAHPNCVSVVDFGVWDGAPYLVMEYVSGTTLRQLIDNGALPARRALALVRQIAAGLAHAHAQGVVHRDVKPANIMISEEIGTGDHVRILDFGLARLRGAVGRDATQANVVVGTPNYMAPEQTVGGGLIDARTDIYAVGVVLFEMVSGDRPFQADDTLALLGMHRAAPIPRLADRLGDDVELPPGLQDVIDKAMAKSPGDRFQSAIELAEAVDWVAGVRGERVDRAERAVRADTARAVRADTASGRDRGAGEPGQLIRSQLDAKYAGTAPTMLDISESAELAALAARDRSRPRGGVFGSLIFIALLVGGVAAAVWWIRHGGSSRGADSQPAAAAASGTASGAAVGAPGPAAGAAGPAAGAPGTASGAATPAPGAATPAPGATAGAAPGTATAPGAATPAPGAATQAPGATAGAAPGTAAGATTAAVDGTAGPANGQAAGAAGAVAAPVGSAAGSSAGTAADPASHPPGSSGSAQSGGIAGPTGPDPASPELGSGRAGPGAAAPGGPGASGEGSAEWSDIELDPATAEDPSPASARPAASDDEAVNAPRTVEEADKVVKRAPSSPSLATTVSGAVQLIKDGRRELALVSLRTLWGKQPASAYIPFLLGNLYFEQRWWSVAIEHYAAAIKKNAKYRSNPTLNRNVIRMLASARTSRKAEGFLKYSVGKSALPYVKYAAQHDGNPQVKRRAAWLVRNL
jgi:serine/threonine-protein kinase